jgi:hypothetical protein
MIFSIKAHTFASYISPDTNQSLQKSMLFSILSKNKKSPPLKKNKTLLSHSPTDKNRMTKQSEKIKGKVLEMKEGQLVTRYIKNWADSTEIKSCSSLQTLYRFDTDMLRSAQLFIYRNRYGQVKKA